MRGSDRNSGEKTVMKTTGRRRIKLILHKYDTMPTLLKNLFEGKVLRRKIKKKPENAISW